MAARSSALTFFVGPLSMNISSAVRAISSTAANRDDTGSTRVGLRLRRLGSDRDLFALSVHVAPDEREELAAPHARFDRADDQPLEMWARHREQTPLFALALDVAFVVQDVRHESTIALRVLLPLDALGVGHRVPRRDSPSSRPTETSL